MEKKSHKTFVHPLVIRVLKSYIYKYQMCVRFHAENSCLWLQGTAWWKIVEEIQKSSVPPVNLELTLTLLDYLVWDVPSA